MCVSSYAACHTFPPPRRSMGSPLGPQGNNTQRLHGLQVRVKQARVRVTQAQVWVAIQVWPPVVMAATSLCAKLLSHPILDRPAISDSVFTSRLFRSYLPFSDMACVTTLRLALASASCTFCLPTPISSLLFSPLFLVLFTHTAPSRHHRTT
jgi:hypothetical protein